MQIIKNTKTKDKNIAIVASLVEKISKAKSILFADYAGLSANEANTLRQKVKENSADMVVAKNTLVKLALKKCDIQIPGQDNLTGQTAVFLSYDDPVSPIKAVFDFAKKAKNESPKAKSALVEGVFVDQDKVQVLGSLPTKDQLIAQVVGTLKSPIFNFVSVMGGTQRKLVYTIKAIADKKK